MKSVPRRLANGRDHGGRSWPTPDKDGYLYLTLADGPRRRRVSVAELVLEVFDRPRPEGMEVLHGPQGRQVNHLSNLRWGTRLENERDKMKDGKERGQKMEIEQGFPSS